ncbi:MAG: PP2C family protein-serine/threonine phosphatase [Bacteroidaceae bacterium]
MLSFRLFAGTNIGLRENNEDNFTVCPNLEESEWIVPADYRQVLHLGSKGCVMVVADGMGGQNAGEVASRITVDTVQELFSTQSLSAEMPDKPDAIKQFLKRVVSECDIRIKKHAVTDASTSGMGSTVVMAWLVGCKLYVAWLGDSRAYSFVRSKGIARLSKDHSYVQQLVDAGAITDEDAMLHPNSNVITRSLGDTSQKAKADVAEYDVEDGQVILLCSDGLCGVCRDEEIGAIIEDNHEDLQQCKERLTSAALAAGGSDNITIALLQVFTDASQPVAQPKTSGNSINGNLWVSMLASVFALGLLLALLFAAVSMFKPSSAPNKSIRIWVDDDTLAVNGRTPFHIAVVGDSISALVYDRDLLEVDYKDSIISVKIPSLLNDRKTCVKVMCKNDISVADSVWILIENSLKLPQMSTSIVEEVCNESETPTVASGPNEPEDSGGQTGGGGSEAGVTKSEGKGLDQVTRNQKKEKQVQISNSLY